jgi:hypothetical protein
MNWILLWNITVLTTSIKSILKVSDLMVKDKNNLNKIIYNLWSWFKKVYNAKKENKIEIFQALCNLNQITEIPKKSKIEILFDHKIQVDNCKLYDFLGWNKDAIYDSQSKANSNYGGTHRRSGRSNDKNNNSNYNTWNKNLAKKIFNFDIDGALDLLYKNNQKSVSLDLFKQFLNFLKENFPSREMIKQILDIKCKSNSEIRKKKHSKIRVIKETPSDDINISRNKKQQSMSLNVLIDRCQGIPFEFS